MSTSRNAKMPSEHSSHFHRRCHRAISAKTFTIMRMNPPNTNIVGPLVGSGTSLFSTMSPRITLSICAQRTTNAPVRIDGGAFVPQCSTA